MHRKSLSILGQTLGFKRNFENNEHQILISANMLNDLTNN